MPGKGELSPVEVETASGIKTTIRARPENAEKYKKAFSGKKEESPPKGRSAQTRERHPEQKGDVETK